MNSDCRNKQFSGGKNCSWNEMSMENVLSDTQVFGCSFGGFLALSLNL